MHTGGLRIRALPNIPAGAKPVCDNLCVQTIKLRSPMRKTINSWIRGLTKLTHAPRARIFSKFVRTSEKVPKSVSASALHRRLVAWLFKCRQCQTGSGNIRQAPSSFLEAEVTVRKMCGCRNSTETRKHARPSACQHVHVPLGNARFSSIWWLENKGSSAFSKKLHPVTLCMMFLFKGKIRPHLGTSCFFMLLPEGA